MSVTRYTRLSPRRGKTSSMATSDKSSIVLGIGEIFVEYPNGGLGSEGTYHIKIGDGVTTYGNLPDAFNSDAGSNTITFSADTSTTVDQAVAKMTSGSRLSVIVAAMKQAISLLNQSANAATVKYPSEITSSGITAKTIIGKSTTGQYISLAANAVIDVRYPILYSEDAVASAGTSTDALLISSSDVSGTTTFSGSGAILYAKGLLNGTTFTVNTITSTEPSTDDGYEYLELGITAGTNLLTITPNHDIYKYTNGIFARYSDSGDYGSEDPLSI